MYNTTIGQVLGVSTAVGGIMSLPYTGHYLPGMFLSYLAIAAGTLVIATFLITRITKLFLTK